MVFTKCTHTCNVRYPSDAVLAADCSDLSPCWSQHQLHCSTHRLPILSNACICKYKHNDKLTSQQYRDTCTWISRETTIFRHVNMLSYCTFWQFWTEAFCQVQQHYGSHGWPMKKRGQWLGSQIATPKETQRCKFMQWPDPLQQSSVCHSVTKGYIQFLKSATYPQHDLSANSQWETNYSSLAGVLIMLGTTIL